jgi:4-amino-4-deoxy-L-arabinose transferase-like glycosyltransferase
MSRTAIDQLVSDYLERLRIATADLPPNEGEELMTNIAEHIATSIEELDPPNEAAVRTILDRLGDPAVIAAEARGLSSQLNAPPPSAKAPGWLEWGGVAMLGIGSYLLPLVGTVAGLTMVSMSRWWSTRQKVVAAVLSLAGVLVIPVIGIGIFAARTSQKGPGPSQPIVSEQPAIAPVPSPTSS